MSSSRPLRVAVAGGGFAAGEALLALRSLAGDRVDLELVTPDPLLAFRPQATTGVFDGREVQTFDLHALARETGATVREDAVRAVFPAAHRMVLASGAQAEYDALLLAVGARARVGVPGAVMFRDQRDVPQVRALVERLPRGELERLVFAVPAGVTWTLPLYELALQAAAAAQTAEVTVVTPEQAPLEAFGRAVSAEVKLLLRDHGVRVTTSTTPRSADRDGLQLLWGGSVAADAVVAAPVLTGRRLPGVPSNFSDFVVTDARGRVDGIDDVWAAGDMTASPIKQGGLAAQQAEMAAADIAALAGAPVAAPAARPVLRAKLLGGARPLYLRAEIGADGRAVDAGAETADETPWWPDAKVFGRHLTPWMAANALNAPVTA